MIRKLLVANRGEIACRIQRTCQRLGIETVAVYSDADTDALHVQEADERVHIGPPPVAQSYLQMDVIVDAALQTGADAIHPGYGLLSENAAFAALCQAKGLTFIGPSPDAIAQMGSKVRSREVAARAGVPTIPGSKGAIANVEEACRTAASLGYPVMLKASFGGGGIGMQLVADEVELRQAFQKNEARARAYFGNGELFLEKHIPAPHHVEIQVLFDQAGNAVYLWERECSIQRRHQKVVEEALSPFVDEPLRERMGAAALAIGRAIGYTGVGTVEFLVDAERRFYFLEMNTRLQVEHPVTEMVTDTDLVALQIAVAQGERLPFTQAEVPRFGHAIECRIYAEDPVKMIPSPGRIREFQPPTGPGVRNDVGVRAGSSVPPFYDAMIGKLIVHGRDRRQAVERMKQALTAYHITGIQTNLPLLQKIVASPAFRKGNTTTDFLAQL
ncbi:MAG: acetyl-CoA carboxylase biotin carboxylase subunit [Alicyclobacillus herbarius]|uniref:acetyl-CoA carboxylase biotin carboxylase subunit n=1 Tax=Alicyclobacillus herbarius TaxID=122960 RepID=UPI0023578371|nr:acetyl-CoA carboxylase biotin carboxylase subunit [Alicyclobacillus herbarius]MCL6631705.1 acetyl-CoA carboxylase biotin carboxylase subunit [Alicyclobacillus herbarius]